MELDTLLVYKYTYYVAYGQQEMIAHIFSVTDKQKL